jgi:HEAT repeat protein
MESRTLEPNRGQSRAPDAREIERLVAALGDHDYLAHPVIRQKLTALGRPAVGPLIAALSNPNDHLRWEAAKTLSLLGDPEAAPTLVQALDDERFGVRWLAAQGLVYMGRAGLPAILQALEHHADSRWLRESVHHVLRLLSEDGLQSLVAPVLSALDDMEPALQAPIVARRVLDQLLEEVHPGRSAGDAPR